MRLVLTDDGATLIDIAFIGEQSKRMPDYVWDLIEQHYERCGCDLWVDDLDMQHGLCPKCWNGMPKEKCERCRKLVPENDLEMGRCEDCYYEESLFDKFNRREKPRD